MNINSSFPIYLFSFFKENLLNSQQRKIFVIASIAFGCFAALYAIVHHYNFKPRLLNDREEEPTPKNRALVRDDDLVETNYQKMLKEIAVLSGVGSDRFGVYITTNDFDFEHSKKEMDIPCRENGVHIGCAGWHNLDIMAARQSKLGIIFDGSTNNKKFIDLTQEMIFQVDNRQAFVEALIQKFKYLSIKVGEDVLNRLPAKRIRDQLECTNSWLGSDESFEYIQNLFKEKKIIAITGDMCDEEKFKKINHIFQKYEFTVDSAYLCNVRYFIQESKQQKFANSINSIINPDTFVIHCPDLLPYQGKDQKVDEWHFPIKDQKNSRRQCVTRGKDLKMTPPFYFVRYAKNVNDKNKIDP